MSRRVIDYWAVIHIESGRATHCHNRRNARSRRIKIWVLLWPWIIEGCCDNIC